MLGGDGHGAIGRVVCFADIGDLPGRKEDLLA